MKTSEMIAVMQAYEEGKEIEFRSKGSNVWHCTNPEWNWAESEYRVKPEIKNRPYEDSEEMTNEETINYLDGSIGVIYQPILKIKIPKYRPYKSTDEMIEDFIERSGTTHSAMNTPMIWVKDKTEKCKHFIDSFYEYKVMFRGYTYDLITLFENYTYLDGSPCGKLEYNNERIFTAKNK